MKLNLSIPRTAKFGVGDFVCVHPDLPSCDTKVLEKIFNKHQPITILGVILVNDKHPYTFKYFAENNIGERRYLRESHIILTGEKHDTLVTVNENIEIESKYEFGDDVMYRTCYERGRGTVVKVDVTKDEIPSFKYLCESSDGTRTFYHENDIVGKYNED